MIASPLLSSVSPQIKRNTKQLCAIELLREVCVCVSHPGSKGFPPVHLSTTAETVSIFQFSQAGGSRVCSWREPTKLQVQTRISKEDALSTYLQPELLTTLSNLLCLIPWFFMLPTPKPFVTAPNVQIDFEAFSTTVLNNTVLPTYAPFRSLTLLPIVAIESN